jgi:hypothetical protein
MQPLDCLVGNHRNRDQPFAHSVIGKNLPHGPSQQGTIQPNPVLVIRHVNLQLRRATVAGCF